MKIADFGLARDVHNIDYYKKTTNVSGKFLKNGAVLVTGHPDVPTIPMQLEQHLIKGG